MMTVVAWVLLLSAAVFFGAMAFIVFAQVLQIPPRASLITTFVVAAVAFVWCMYNRTDNYPTFTIPLLFVLGLGTSCLFYRSERKLLKNSTNR